MLYTIANMLRKGSPELYCVDWRKATNDYNTNFLLRMADLLDGEQKYYMLMLKLIRRQIICEAADDENIDIQFETLDSVMVQVMHKKFDRPYLEWVRVRETSLMEYCELQGLPMPPRFNPDMQVISNFDALIKIYGQHKATLADAFCPELIGDHDPINSIGILMASAKAANMIRGDMARPVFVQMVFEARPQFFDEKRTPEKVVGAVNDLLENTSLFDIRDSGSLKVFIYSLYSHPNKQEKAWNLAFNLFVKLKAA